MTYLVDTHAHIDMIEKASAEEVVHNACENGVEKIIIPGVEPSTFKKILEIAQKFDNVYVLLGVHPSEAKTYDDKAEALIREFSENKKVVGIGETGLDYYWDKSFNELQKEIFIKQIKLANELNLPIVVHDREAHKDTFDILKEHNRGSDVVMHCFSGSTEFARECTKAGFYLALGGVVTFKNAVKMKDTAIDMPLDKMLLETDSPYLTPAPHRGEENRPANVKFVAEEIANLRGISYDEIANITTSNAEKVFKIKPI